MTEFSATADIFAVRGPVQLDSIYDPCGEHLNRPYLMQGRENYFGVPVICTDMPSSSAFGVRGRLLEYEKR